jgi:hypothetical protein
MPVGFALAIAALPGVSPSTSAALGKRSRGSPTALGVLVSLERPEARSRLSTIAGVVPQVVEPDMALGVYALGVGETGSELAYGRAPDTVPRPYLRPKPKPPSDPTPLAQHVYEEKELKPWQREVNRKLADWQARRTALARRWARRKTAGLINVTTRGEQAPTRRDLAVGLFRAGKFFAQVKGEPVLVVLIDRMPIPPDGTLRYGLRGVHAVLVGWKTDRPLEFQQRSTAWKALFHAQQAAPRIVVLARGLDTIHDISAAIAVALR